MEPGFEQSGTLTCRLLIDGPKDLLGTNIHGLNLYKVAGGREVHEYRIRDGGIRVGGIPALGTGCTIG